MQGRAGGRSERADGALPRDGRRARDGRALQGSCKVLLLAPTAAGASLAVGRLETRLAHCAERRFARRDARRPVESERLHAVKAGGLDICALRGVRRRVLQRAWTIGVSRRHLILLWRAVRATLRDGQVAQRGHAVRPALLAALDGGCGRGAIVASCAELALRLLVVRDAMQGARDTDNLRAALARRRRAHRLRDGRRGACWSLRVLGPVLLPVGSWLSACLADGRAQMISLTLRSRQVTQRIEAHACSLLLVRSAVPIRGPIWSPPLRAIAVSAIAAQRRIEVGALQRREVVEDRLVVPGRIERLFIGVFSGPEAAEAPLRAKVVAPHRVGAVAPLHRGGCCGRRRGGVCRTCLRVIWRGRSGGTGLRVVSLLVLWMLRVRIVLRLLLMLLLLLWIMELALLELVLQPHGLPVDAAVQLAVLLVDGDAVVRDVARDRVAERVRRHKVVPVPVLVLLVVLVIGKVPRMPQRCGSLCPIAVPSAYGAFGGSSLHALPSVPSVPLRIAASA